MEVVCNAASNDNGCEYEFSSSDPGVVALSTYWLGLPVPVVPPPVKLY